MPRRDTVQYSKALLVLLIVGLPSYAQSRTACSSWLPKFDANQYLADPFTRGGFESALNRDAPPTRPSESGELVRLVPTALADGFNPDSTVASVTLLPQAALCQVWSVSQPRFSGPGSDKSGTAHVDNDIGEDSKRSSATVVPSQKQPDLDRAVYYRNKLEFAFDGGWLPINIPFVFDVFLGDAYNRTPLSYTLVPLVASLRWHINDVAGPWIFRGNWDMTVSGSVTLIPRGPETHYFSYDMGIRRNFVPRRGKIAPYFDGRLGLGHIDAKEPLGVVYAQGQNFTFTMNLGSGVRYNFNSQYSLSAGLHWMHISNLYLSEPAFSNYGINVYGPMFGIDVRLGKPRHASK